MDLYEKKITFEKNYDEDDLNNFDIYQDLQNSNFPTFFLKSKFNYYQKNAFNYGINADVKLCFHDNKISQDQNYFILGDSQFLLDWNYYQEKMKKKDFQEIGENLVYRILDNNNIDNYSITYDNDMWRFYDYKPIKAFKSKISTFCDYFVGKFFIHRSGFSVVFKKNLDGALETFFF